ncbi:hypothetical protein MES4922_40077 [Mesorhizobium ventifaucium]|uniref:Transposase n=1 Tax=Mesorhizobium ventifaucium TaxID=666020 RepID=A0ABN8K7S0_9HYPH|nr:hypothetical protein MES4922_40077 [Mesorhizobium ventifaucium]
MHVGIPKPLRTSGQAEGMLLGDMLAVSGHQILYVFFVHPQRR